MIDRWPAEAGVRGRIVLWISLCVVALASRLGGVYYLPTPEQDGFSHAETIARFSALIGQGRFRFSDLYGFWLPLFQFVAAVPNIWLKNPLLAGAMLSALCGAAACVLVFAVAMRLTRSLIFSGLAFVIVLLSPVHLLYSSACMTDVPFGCLLLASLLFVLRGQWAAGMIAIAIAGGVRVDAWALIPLLPLLQWIKERRVSIIGVIALLATPVLWLCVSELARGDWFAFFNDRVIYQGHYMDFHPSRRGFTLADVFGDLDLLMFGANRFVFLAAIVAAFILPFKIVRRAADSWEPFVTLAYFGVLLAFLVLGYVTKRQPVWLPRYGLFGLVLGAPLLVWLLGLLRARSRRVGRIAVLVAILLCASETRSQFSIIPKVLGDFHGRAHVAEALRSAIHQDGDPTERYFSDDVAVRVLSGLPAARLAQSGEAPSTAWDDAAAFEAFLQRSNVRYLVFFATENSLPVKWLSLDQRPTEFRSIQLERIASASSDFGPDVVLLRLKD